MASAARLFDLDGTLVDTMPLHFEAYRRVFEEVGLSLTRHDFDRAAGGPARVTIPRLVAGRRCPVSAEELHHRKLEVASRLLEHWPLDLLPTAGLLAEDGLCGLVTSGARPGVLAIIERLGWSERFTTIVTGDEVVRGKPHPEGYLLAASELGVAPTTCVAYEDSDDGVAAARSAGMTVVDVRACSAR